MATSIVNQGLLLQRETTPGTPVTSAMKRYYGIKGTVGWDVQTEKFRAGGSKAVTGENILTEMGKANLEVIQDYNAMLPLLTGVFGEPTTTALTGTGGETAYQHKFAIKPFAADTLVTYTGMWGGSARALQVSALAFHALTIGVQRTQLSLSSNAILRAPKRGVAWPSTGVTDVPFVPIRAQSYCVFMDDTKADLGTTQLLALYKTEVNYGEKYEPDWVVNCNLESYSELLEREGIDYTQSMQVGFDGAADALIDDIEQGMTKFVRVKSEGPLINDTDKYGLMVDTAVKFHPDEVGKADSSVATVLNLNGTLMVTDGFLSEVTLVNTVAAA